MCFTSVNGQNLESIPSSSVTKKPGEILNLSCRGSGFDFGQYGMHWIRQPAGKALSWMGAIWPGQVLSLSCKISGYSVTDSSYCTGFIRQPAGKALEWVGEICGIGIDSYELTQPESLTVRPDATLTISCKVSVTGYGTGWIRQPAGKSLEWIGAIWSGGGLDYKDSLKSKFSITRDTSSNTITLQGNNMQAQDTAVYYCARESQ
ncbi:unnamed protein product [Leuciscus chuanchicus]